MEREGGEIRERDTVTEETEETKRGGERLLLVSGPSFPSQALLPPAPFAARSGGEATSPKSLDRAGHSPPVGKSHDSHVSTM